MKEMNTHNRGLQRAMGYMSSLVMLGLAGSESVEPSESLLMFWDSSFAVSLSPIYLLFGLLFLATALFVSLGSVQVGILFLLSALQATQSSARLYGLGFALVAAVIGLRRGWFVRRPLAKAALVSAIGCLSLLGPILASDAGLRAIAPALIGASVFVIFVFGLARGRVLSAFAPKKRVLRLADYKLSPRESLVVKLRLSGKSAKEIAIENGIALSTVRNALSLAYRKLGIEGCEALMAIGERYTVI
jgi:DNA-binding CsgD family transcriptional regulator